MPLILTFGDSNTHGTPPLTRVGDDPPRFGPGVRWPTVAADRLGWDLAEEGLPGRTAQFADPVMGAEMDGRLGLKIALRSHAPIDVLTIMLGTNDLKARFGPTPARVTAGIAALLDIARGEEWQARHGGFRILLIAPPTVVETGPFEAEFVGAAAIAAELPARYAALARAHGCGFLDAAQVIRTCAEDGIHFDAAAHQALGEAVADAVRELARPS